MTKGEHSVLCVFTQFSNQFQTVWRAASEPVSPDIDVATGKNGSSTPTVKRQLPTCQDTARLAIQDKQLVAIRVPTKADSRCCKLRYDFSIDSILSEIEAGIQGRCSSIQFLILFDTAPSIRHTTRYLTILAPAFCTLYQGAICYPGVLPAISSLDVLFELVTYSCVRNGHVDGVRVVMVRVVMVIVRRFGWVAVYMSRS